MCVSSVFRPIVLFRLSWSFVLFSFNNQECVNESREITFSKPKIVSSLAVRILKSLRTIYSKYDFVNPSCRLRQGHRGEHWEKIHYAHDEPRQDIAKLSPKDTAQTQNTL